MGNCCGGGASQEDEENLDPGERRRRQAEAAERRMKEEQGRGLADPEGAKRRIEAKERAAREADTGISQEGGMKWQVS